MSGPKGFTSFNSTCNSSRYFVRSEDLQKSQNPTRLTGWFLWFPFWKWMVRMSNAKWSLPFMVQTFPEHQPVPVYMKIWNSGYQLVQPPSFAIIWNNSSLALPLWNQKKYHPTRVFHLCSRSTWIFNNIWCNLRLSGWQGFGTIWPKLRPEFRLENSRCRLSRKWAN